MKSPFPGMDPYLERHWLDVHGRLVTYAADQLNERLPPSLVARSEERIAVDSEDFPGDTVRVGPDVRVFEPGISEESTTGVTYAAPYKLVVDLDPVKEHLIHIVGTDDERVITVIEFLSPTNKTGKGLAAYRKKRAELNAGGIHVVEIDLVRRGDWRDLMRPHTCPHELWTDYRVTVRLGRSRAAYLYPVSLRSPLPSVAIPLRKKDPEVKLDLQPLIEDVYVRGRYGQTINYRRALLPPVSADDAAWLEKLLAKRPKRVGRGNGHG